MKKQSEVKTIKVSCRGADLVNLNELKDFQKGLKKLSNENFFKLKNNILKYGFSAPIFIWKKGEEKFILDGKQRLLVLKELERSGYEIPPLPVDYVDAKDEREAKRKLLAITSQYGKIERSGLDIFLSEAQMELKDVIGEIDLEGIKLEKIDDWQEKEEVLENFKETHILLSFHPDLFAKIQPHLEKIVQIEGVEHEQSSN